jgi:hypothetical protein
MLYEIKKVFDFATMSFEVKEAMLSIMGRSPDTYVSWTVSTEFNESVFIDINNWLIDNGAGVGEKILINYHW